MIVKEGKITWHLTENVPTELGEWSEPIYIGRPPIDRNFRTFWKDGTTTRAPTGKRLDELRAINQHMPSMVGNCITEPKRAIDSQIPDESETRLIEPEPTPDFSPTSADNDQYWETHQ